MTASENIKINIIGRGNVAVHLKQAFDNVGAEAVIVNPRTLDTLQTDADFIIISVSDNAIREVAARIPSDTQAIVAHTSGTTGIDIFENAGYRHGVFYPLQTFTKGVALSYDVIPIYVEGSDKETENKIAQLARIISWNVRHADSAKRRALHVASVFACNFTNHLWAIAEELLESEGLESGDLEPLVKETLRKAFETGAAKGQTGPAIRHDSVTIDRHLAMLADRPELADIYKTLTESIQNHERNKL